MKTVSRLQLAALVASIGLLAGSAAATVVPAGRATPGAHDRAPHDALGEALHGNVERNLRGLQLARHDKGHHKGWEKGKGHHKHHGRSLEMRGPVVVLPTPPAPPLPRLPHPPLDPRDLPRPPLPPLPRP